MKDVTFDLVCELDDAEVQSRALQMSSTVIRIDEVEAAKKEATKDFGEELGSLRGELRRLSGIVRSRSERRAVLCAVEFHSPVQGTKRISRRDTGEFVRDEPMSAFEMQDNLFEPPPPQPIAEGALPENFSQSLIAEMAKDVDGSLQAQADATGNTMTIESGGKTLAEFKPRRKSPKAN